jgi:hypothetical protein
VGPPPADAHRTRSAVPTASAATRRARHRAWRATSRDRSGLALRFRRAPPTVRARPATVRAPRAAAPAATGRTAPAFTRRGPAAPRPALPERPARGRARLARA